MSGEKPGAKTEVSAEVAARLARRERRRDRSREEILDAARQVLLRNGVGAMTLDAVAKEVGVSKTALYYYYPSKDALLFELMFGVWRTHAQLVHGCVGEGWTRRTRGSHPRIGKDLRAAPR